MTTDNKIKNFIDKWENVNFIGVTPQIYKDFEKEYKDVLESVCSDISFSIKKFYPGHFEFCGVLQNNENGRFFDISISDVRYDSFCYADWSADIPRCVEHKTKPWCDSILYRVSDDKRINSTAFSPGLHGKHYAHLEKLSDGLVDLNKKYSAYVQGKIDEHEEQER